MELYTHKTWAADEQILASQLNNIEDGIEAALTPRYVVDQGGAKGTHATIQAAIDAAEVNGGGDVYILNNGSDFSISGSGLIINNPYVNLYGVGHPTVEAANGLNDDLLNIVSDCCIIKGIIFEGNRANNTSGSIILIDSGAVLVSILNCLIRAGTENGIWLKHAHQCFIGQNTRITDNDENGIELGVSGAGNGENNAIIGCYLYDNNKSGSTFDEIVIQQSSYSRIIGNHINANSSSKYCVNEQGVGDYTICTSNVAENGVTGQFNITYVNSVFGNNVP